MNACSAQGDLGPSPKRICPTPADRGVSACMERQCRRDCLRSAPAKRFPASSSGGRGLRFVAASDGRFRTLISLRERGSWSLPKTHLPHPCGQGWGKCGTGGIRTLGNLLGYVPLARECFRPLSHRSLCEQVGRVKPQSRAGRQPLRENSWRIPHRLPETRRRRGWQQSREWSPRLARRRPRYRRQRWPRGNVRPPLHPRRKPLHRRRFRPRLRQRQPLRHRRLHRRIPRHRPRFPCQWRVS